MSILFVMIPLALVLLAAAVAAFFWAVRSGQFDDLDAQGTLVLFDEEAPTRIASRATSASSQAGRSMPASSQVGGTQPR
ncbi:MAG: cbb3-type cytochrome oxidase assembly protein CcoS [Candidatus Binatia bacterium]